VERYKQENSVLFTCAEWVIKWAQYSSSDSLGKNGTVQYLYSRNNTIEPL